MKKYIATLCLSGTLACSAQAADQSVRIGDLLTRAEAGDAGAAKILAVGLSRLDGWGLNGAIQIDANLTSIATHMTLRSALQVIAQSSDNGAFGRDPYPSTHNEKPDPLPGCIWITRAANLPLEQNNRVYLAEAEEIRPIAAEVARKLGAIDRWRCARSAAGWHPK